MTRRGVFSVITGFIAGLFGTARARSAQSLGVELIPGPTKDVKKYYLSYFVPDKNEGHYELVPFITDSEEIINVMNKKLRMEIMAGISFDSWTPRILSKEDIDSNTFVGDPRLAGYKRWTS